MSKEEKHASIADGRWLLVLQNGELWAPPEGASLRRYDSKTLEALKDGLKPKDAFALSVVKLEDPSSYKKLDIEVLRTRLVEQAKGHRGPVSDGFLLLDEWLVEQKEAGLPKAWRRDVFRSDALMGVISELIRPFSEMSLQHVSSYDDFLAFIQALMDGVIPEVQEGSVIDDFLKSLWPEDDPRWNLVKTCAVEVVE